MPATMNLPMLHGPAGDPTGKYKRPFGEREQVMRVPSQALKRDIQRCGAVLHLNNPLIIVCCTTTHHDPTVCLCLSFVAASF
jgi:hypothetical protein